MPVADDEGNISIRSQAYTEYFVHGTEPVDFCPLHSGFFGSTNTLVSSEAPSPSDTRAPDRRDEHRPVVTGGVATATPPAAQPTEQQQEPPKKKRGFWGRIFG